MIMSVRKPTRFARHKPRGPVRAPHLQPVDTAAWRDAAAFVFDVEGTLVDAVMPTLLSWRATLARFGHAVSLADLHRLSGMDGHEMLAHLVPTASPSEREAMIERQGDHYREEYLATVPAFPRVRALFEALKRKGCKVAVATDCEKDELAHYLAVAGIEDLVDACACGDDVRRGKPQPRVIEMALRRIRALGKLAVMVGDTPCDAQAARRAGILPVGVLTGHFSESDLREAGCRDVRRDPAALLAALQAESVDNARERGAA
jgi:phosphoglycolate phosphatase-like HAD superfamily hydrolase